MYPKGQSPGVERHAKELSKVLRTSWSHTFWSGDQKSHCACICYGASIYTILNAL